MCRCKNSTGRGSTSSHQGVSLAFGFQVCPVNIAVKIPSSDYVACFTLHFSFSAFLLVDVMSYRSACYTFSLSMMRLKVACKLLLQLLLPLLALCLHDNTPASSFSSSIMFLVLNSYVVSIQNPPSFLPILSFSQMSFMRSVSFCIRSSNLVSVLQKTWGSHLNCIP